MTQDKTEKLYDRARKLLALSSSPNEHEALRATEKLQAMLAEHNLELADITGNSPGELDHQWLLMDRAVWVKPLLSATARLCFCGYFLETFPSEWVRKRGLHTENRKVYGGGSNRQYIRHNFVGQKHNIIIAKTMAEYLISTVERLCKEGEKTVPASERVRYKTAFLNACTIRLCARMRKMREDAEREGIKTEGRNLPALLSLYQQSQSAFEQWKIDSGKNMNNVKFNLARISHAQGARDGLSAGEKIGLNQQISSKNNERLAAK